MTVECLSSMDLLGNGPLNPCGLATGIMVEDKEWKRDSECVRGKGSGRRLTDLKNKYWKVCLVHSRELLYLVVSIHIWYNWREIQTDNGPKSVLERPIFEALHDKWVQRPVWNHLNPHGLTLQIAMNCWIVVHGPVRKWSPQSLRINRWNCGGGGQRTRKVIGLGMWELVSEFEIHLKIRKLWLLFLCRQC